MNRTQGDDDWVVVRPFLQVPSNCIAPRAYVERIREVDPAAVNYEATYALCGQSQSFGTFDPATDVLGYLAQAYGFTYDPFAPYNPDTVGALVPYDPANPDAWRSQAIGAPTGGRGFFAYLGGTEFPTPPRVDFHPERKCAVVGKRVSG